MADVPAVGAGVTLVAGFASSGEFDAGGTLVQAARDAITSSEIKILFFLIRFLSKREIVYNILIYHVING